MAAYNPFFLFTAIYHVLVMVIFTLCALYDRSNVKPTNKAIKLGRAFVLVYAIAIIIQDVYVAGRGEFFWDLGIFVQFGIWEV